MKFSASLFRRDKVVLFLVITTAILGVIGLPQKTGMSDEQLILAILAIIALDMLVEKLGYLDRIEADLDDLRKNTEKIERADAVFKPRSEVPSFETLMQKGQELWISGKSLSGFIATYGKQIEESTKVGYRYRFLVHDPSNRDLMRALSSSSYSNPNEEIIKSLVESSLLHLKRLEQDCLKGCIEYRIANALLPNGFTIVNGRESSAAMYVELFSYKVSLGERLSLYLTRHSDPRTFLFYFNQFENLWADAQPVKNDLLERSLGPNEKK